VSWIETWLSFGDLKRDGFVLEFWIDENVGWALIVFR
jgi:hypothetical protein